MVTPSRLIISFHTLVAFIVLGSALVISTAPHPLRVDEVKLDILFLSFQFIALHLPIEIFITLLITFSIMQEMLSGASLGFYVLLYALSLVGPTYFIHRQVYQINFLLVLIYLLITGFLKMLFSILLLLNIYNLNYLYSFFFKISLKELVLNIGAATTIYFLILLTKYICNLLYTLVVTIRQL